MCFGCICLFHFFNLSCWNIFPNSPRDHSVSQGGLCLRNAERLRSTTHWASWAHNLPVIRARHPDVVDHMLESLSRGVGGFHLSAEIALLQLVLTPQNGATWFEGSVQGLIQMTSSPRFRLRVAILRFFSNGALSSGVQCGQGWVRLNKRLPFTARAHGWDTIPLFLNVTGVSFGPAVFSRPPPAATHRFGHKLVRSSESKIRVR